MAEQQKQEEQQQQQGEQQELSEQQEIEQGSEIESQTKSVVQQLPNKHKRTRTYVKNVFDAILEKPDILDVLILNTNGEPVKSTMAHEKAVKFGGLYQTLFEKVQRFIQMADAKDELEMLRVRTTKSETLMVPDGKITIMVFQNAKDDFQNGK